MDTGWDPPTWYISSSFSRVIGLLLFAMLLEVIFIFLARFSHLQLQRFRARPLRRALASDSVTGNVLMGAARTDSHIAPLVLAGIEKFRSAPAHLSDRQAVTAAEFAMQRLMGNVRAKLHSRLGTLASITALAPLLGLVATTIEILGAFGPIGMARATAIAFLSGHLAGALVFTSIGLAVGILAQWSHNLLARQGELLAAQLQEATLRLRVILNAGTIPRDPHPIDGPDEGLLTGNRSFEIPCDRFRTLGWFVFLTWLYVVCTVGSAALCR